MRLKQIEREEKSSVAVTWTAFCEGGHILQSGINPDNFHFVGGCKYCGARVRLIADDSELNKGFGNNTREDVILCWNLTNNHQWHEKISVYELSDELKKLFV